MVIAVITPQLGQIGTGLTWRIGTEMFVARMSVTLMPASEVGRLPASANTGSLRVLPTPAANIVMICPGAMLIEPGNKYPAPTIVFGLALWPTAETEAVATSKMRRVAAWIMPLFSRD
jgi:hypothetical protein